MELSSLTPLPALRDSVAIPSAALSLPGYQSRYVEGVVAVNTILLFYVMGTTSQHLGVKYFSAARGNLSNQKSSKFQVNTIYQFNLYITKISFKARGQLSWLGSTQWVENTPMGWSYGVQEESVTGRWRICQDQDVILDLASFSLTAWFLCVVDKN